MPKKIVISNYTKLDNYWGIGLKDKKSNIWVDTSGSPRWQEEPRLSVRIDPFSTSVHSKKIFFIIQENVNDPNPFVIDEIQTPWLSRVTETRTFYFEDFLHSIESSDSILFEKDYLIRAAISGKFLTELITLAVFRKYDTGTLFYTDCPSSDEVTLHYFFGKPGEEEDDKSSNCYPTKEDRCGRYKDFNKDIIKIDDIEKITENPKTPFLINL